MNFIKNNTLFSKTASGLVFLWLISLPFSSSGGEFSDDILSSLNESNKEVSEYYQKKVSSYRCVITGQDSSFDCEEQGVDIYSMYEADRFDVALNKKNSLEKIVFMEISGVNKKNFSEYEEKTLKRCVKNIRCESMDVKAGKTVEKKLDIMFVLHGGTEIVKDTILVGYEESKGDN